MPEITERVASLHRQREDLKRQLAEIGDMSPGSLTGRYRKCGKPSCHCAQADSQGHGPSWSLTRQVHGKTVTKIIPVMAVEDPREHLEEYQRLRSLSRELVEVSVQICDAQLEAPARTSSKAVKERGSKKSLRSSSPKRSRSS